LVAEHAPAIAFALHEQYMMIKRGRLRDRLDHETMKKSVVDAEAAAVLRSRIFPPTSENIVSEG
jgi:hypothetical protein